LRRRATQRAMCTLDVKATERVEPKIRRHVIAA
jgi:hypothetical protein